MKKHDRDLLAEEGEALRKELRERTKGMTNFEDRLLETLRADIDLCRRDIDHIGARLNKLERPAVTTRDLLDEQDQAEQLGAFREREAIVKWLRDRSAPLRTGHPIFQICADEVEMNANMIEKGEHTPNLTKQAVVVRKIDPTKPKVSYRNPLTLKLCSEDYSKGFAAATEAIVKYLIARGEWDSTTGNCLHCKGVGFVDYDSQGIDQLCCECHVDLGELITSVEKGEHLK